MSVCQLSASDRGSGGDVAEEVAEDVGGEVGGVAGPAGAEAGRDEPVWGGEAEADMNGHYVGPAMRENKARCKGGGFT